LRALRVGLPAAVVFAVLFIPQAAGAHGIGGRSDLPVPLEYFLVGGGVVLLLSFGALAVLWPSPRLQDGPRQRGAGWAVPGWVSAAAAGVGLFGLGLVVAAGLFGDPSARSNVAPVAVWVVAWLVLPFAAALLGNFWSVVSPWRTIGRLARLDGRAGPGFLGVWPAAGLFVAITWMELVYPRSGEPGALGAAAVVYAALILGLALRVGIDRAVASSAADRTGGSVGGGGSGRFRFSPSGPAWRRSWWR